MAYNSRVQTTYLIRGLQLFFAILVMSLSAFVVDVWGGNGRPAFDVAVGVLTIPYLVFVLAFPQLLVPIVVFVCEIFFTLFWLIAFALAADYAGAGDCTWLSGYGRYKSACQSAKAVIAFSLFNWLLFALSLTLVVIRQVMPLSKNHSSWSEKRVVLRGGIFPLSSTLTTVDPENLPAAETEPKTHEQEPDVFVSDNTAPRS